MPSPFPGMDPYLEGALWPDVHHRLATEISDRLTPLIRPRYVARLEVTIVEDRPTLAELSLMYPDVELLRRRPSSVRETRPAVDPSAIQRTITAPLTLRLPPSLQVRLATVEIRATGQHELVTCIEILSPVNKREPGLAQYREKRQKLYDAGVHLLEIDLLRRGTRPLVHDELPDVPYLVTLTRAGSNQVDVWPITVREALPCVAVPLRAPDADVPLDLSAAFTSIYDRAEYALSIDYRQAPPPPAFTPADTAWIQATLQREGV